MKVLAVVLAVICLTRVGSIARGEGAKPSDLVVVRGAKAGLAEQHAAREFASYAERMTGEKIEVQADDVFSSKKKCIVLIGTAATNAVVKSLEGKGTLNASRELPSSEDGFVVRTVDDGERKYLILAGRSGRASAYAVYHYLERFCQVGFFADGENVPKLKEIPFSDIQVVEEPGFRYRVFRGSAGVRGPKLYQSMLWNLDDWKKHIDWGLKKRYNCMYIVFDGGDIADEDLLRSAFPEVKFPVRSPEQEDWIQYRRNARKEAFRYARDRGIMTMAHVGYDYPWPDFFEDSFPELKAELEKRGGTRDFKYYGPDNPFRKKFTGRLWTWIVNEYGRSPIYFLSYASESPEKQYLEAESIKQAHEILSSTDPGARILQETWGFYCNHWTREQFNQWDEIVPRDVAVLDRVAQIGGSYKKYGYFNGRDWILDFINELCGSDQLHVEPSLSYFKRLLRGALEDPQARNCVGVSWLPESMRTNIFFEDFLSELFWDPYKVEEDKFIESYVVRRYGQDSQDNMLRSMREAVAGMTYGKMLERRCNGGGNCPLEYPYVMRSFTEEGIRLAQLGIEHWERALECALLEATRRGGNELYDMYLIELFRSYCAKVFQLPLLRLSRSCYNISRIQEFNVRPDENLSLFIYRNSFDNPYWPEAAKFARLADAEEVEGLSFIPRHEGLVPTSGEKVPGKGEITYRFTLPSPHHLESGKLKATVGLVEGSSVRIAVEGQQWEQIYDSAKEGPGNKFISVDLPASLAGRSSFRVRFMLVGPGSMSLRNIALECRAKQGSPFEEKGFLLREEIVSGTSPAREKEVFEEEAKKLFLIYDCLDRVVSTSKYFSIAELVKEVDGYPGEDPNSRQAIIGTLATPCGYWSSALSENIRFVLKPMFETVVDGLRTRIEEKKGIPAGDLYSYGEITGKWGDPIRQNAERAIAEELKRRAETGPTSAVVSEAYDELKKAGCHSSEYSELVGTRRRQAWLVFSNMGNLPYNPIGSEDDVYLELKNYDDNLIRGFDFGVGVPVREDYIRVLPTTAYEPSRGYGWVDIGSLDSWNEGYPDDLYGDFIFGDKNSTFRVDLPAGSYRVTVFPRNFDHEQGWAQVPLLSHSGKVAVKAGNLPWRELETKPVSKTAVSFGVELSNGKLDIELKSLTGKPWAVAGMVIQRRAGQ